VEGQAPLVDDPLAPYSGGQADDGMRSLSEALFVPEPFRSENKEAIEQRSAQ